MCLIANLHLTVVVVRWSCAPIAVSSTRVVPRAAHVWTEDPKVIGVHDLPGRELAWVRHGGRFAAVTNVGDAERAEGGCGSWWMVRANVNEQRDAQE